MLAVEGTMATASISWRERDGGGWFGFKDDTGIARTATERRIVGTSQTSRARGSGSLPPPGHSRCRWRGASSADLLFVLL